MAASIAVAETVESCGIAKAELKWPNDVLVNGRKIAGILLEAALTSVHLEYVIIGLGLNLNSSPDDFPHDLRESVTSVAILSRVESTMWKNPLACFSTRCAAYMIA